MTDILINNIGPHDSRRGGRSIILYDGRDGYQFSGIEGNTLLPAMELVLGNRQLSLTFDKVGDPVVLSPVLVWRGWCITLIDGDGARVRIDDKLYHSMYFVWDELVIGEGEEEPDRYSVPEEEPEDMATSDEVRHMLCQLTRVPTGYTGSGPQNLRRVIGYKDELFNRIPSTAWELLPAADLKKA